MHDGFIAGADDFAAGDELFQPVGTPAGYAGDGEQGREHFFRNAQHFVYEAGIHIDVGADGFSVFKLLV